MQVDFSEWGRAVEQGRIKTLVAKLDHCVGDAPLVQQFDGARLHRQRTRSVRRRAVLVDQAHGNAQARQLQRCGQARRSGADDEDGTIFLHGDLHLAVHSDGSGMKLAVKRCPEPCAAPIVRRERGLHDAQKYAISPLKIKFGTKYKQYILLI